MKKILLLLLACMMILCAGCAGTEKEPVETEPVTEPTTEPTEPETTEPPERYQGNDIQQS